MLVYHATFCINSLAHVHRQAALRDRRRLPQQLAAGVFTMGEGWHNNHHAYQSSARQGFRWWEYDPTFYMLKLLERLGRGLEPEAPDRRGACATSIGSAAG